MINFRVNEYIYSHCRKSELPGVQWIIIKENRSVFFCFFVSCLKYLFTVSCCTSYIINIRHYYDRISMETANIFLGPLLCISTVESTVIRY